MTRHCNKKCPVKQECLRRMGLPQNFRFPIWKERPLTAKEIEIETKYYNETGNVLFHGDNEKEIEPGKSNRYMWELKNK